MNVHSLGSNFENWIQGTLWPSMSIDVINRYNDKLEQRKNGDFMIRIKDEGVRNVDVKAENNTPPNFPIEILQDWTSLDLGWFYTLLSCDEVWYGRHVDGFIDSVYRISLLRLRCVSNNISKKWNVRKAVKNYGDTIIITAPLNDLLDHRIAKKVYQAESSKE